MATLEVGGRDSISRRLTMTNEELKETIMAAVAAVKAMTPRERRSFQQAGILDRRFDVETGELRNNTRM